MSALSRRDLRLLYVFLDGRRGADAEALRTKLRLLIAERAGERAWGAKVFELTIPLSVKRTVTRGKRAGRIVTDHLAPTMNVYGSMEVFQRAALYKAIDLRILAECSKWPRCLGATDKRAVRVTRRSSVKLDEVTVDVCGGKVPLDRLVQAGILRGDTTEDLEREAVWEKARPGQGCLIVEVFELLAPGLAGP
jgi:hypothetical protein